MFSDIDLVRDRPLYLQLKDYIKQMILKGILREGQKLPSSRELSSLINISRNTVMQAYEFLEEEGFVYSIKGKGTFVSDVNIQYHGVWSIDWSSRLTPYAIQASKLDIVKHESKWEKGMISFKSIAPDDTLFDVEDFKRAFLNRFSLEGQKLLNYGYAQGYKPLIDYLLTYMENKGVNVEGKNILITNGFTEGFDVILSALAQPGSKILCENPTHNTAIKIMKLHQLDIIGVDMEEDGVNLSHMKECLDKNKIDMAFLIPSYHNPTGIVMSAEKRVKAFKMLEQYKVPIIEDGFSEELKYTGSHMAPLIALCGTGNSVLYIGSLSKVLFPGIRIGWILGDKYLIHELESIKRSRNIHTSTLDQGILYEYLISGGLDKYLKRARKEYRAKHDFATQCARKYIPCRRILGEGGLHIFIELEEDIDARVILEKCCQKGVIFMPGDLFFTDGSGRNTFRLGFARLSMEDIEKGIQIIGQTIREI